MPTPGWMQRLSEREKCARKTDSLSEPNEQTLNQANPQPKQSGFAVFRIRTPRALDSWWYGPLSARASRGRAPRAVPRRATCHGRPEPSAVLESRAKSCDQAHTSRWPEASKCFACHPLARDKTNHTQNYCPVPTQAPRSPTQGIADNKYNF